MNIGTGDSNADFRRESSSGRSEPEAALRQKTLAILPLLNYKSGPGLVDWLVDAFVTLRPVLRGIE